MAREDLHFRLRLPEELKVRILDAAEMNDRSMTAEIVARLQWTFGPADEEMQSLLDQQAKLEEARQALSYRLDLAMSELAETRKQLIEEAGSREDLLMRASKAEARLDAYKDAVGELRAENYSLQEMIRRDDALPGDTNKVSAQPLTSALFDELFGGSRLAREMEKVREDIATAIEGARRRQLTEEDKEEIWQWLQKKDEAEKDEQ